MTRPTEVSATGIATTGLALPGVWVADPSTCTASFTVRSFGRHTVTG
jgi:hypothetical protein